MHSEDAVWVDLVEGEDLKGADVVDYGSWCVFSRLGCRPCQFSEVWYRFHPGFCWQEGWDLVAVGVHSPRAVS